MEKSEASLLHYERERERIFETRPVLSRLFYVSSMCISWAEHFWMQFEMFLIATVATLMVIIAICNNDFYFIQYDLQQQQRCCLHKNGHMRNEHCAYICMEEGISGIANVNDWDLRVCAPEWRHRIYVYHGKIIELNRFGRNLFSVCVIQHQSHAVVLPGSVRHLW